MTRNLATWVFLGCLAACADGNDPTPTGGQSAGGGGSSGDGGGATTEGGGGTTSDGGGGSGGRGGLGAEGGEGGAGLCGNGELDDGEECDTTPNVSCVDRGYVSGILACADDCTFDVSDCEACHNHVVEPELGEDCDFDSQGDPLVLATCVSLGFPESPANPGCTPDCHYDTKICNCGNGALEAIEDCDGVLLGGHTCAGEGFTSGTISCDDDCQLDTTNCALCGNGDIESGEQCDDSNMSSGDGCSSTCQTESVSCDPDGAYLVAQPIAYSCCSGLVSVNVSQFLFTQNGAAISSSPSNPATMIGLQTTCPSGSFINSASISGGCTETYTVSGQFNGNDTWTGTYQVQFTGPDCDCFGGMFGTPCIGQVYSVSASR